MGLAMGLAISKSVSYTTDQPPFKKEVVFECEEFAIKILLGSCQRSRSTLIVYCKNLTLNLLNKIVQIPGIHRIFVNDDLSILSINTTDRDIVLDKLKELA
jgi:hypothetical protein